MLSSRVESNRIERLISIWPAAKLVVRLVAKLFVTFYSPTCTDANVNLSLSLLDFVACLWERSRLLKHHHRRRHSRIESVNARTERSARVLSSFCNYDFSRAKRDTNRERGREREPCFPGISDSLIETFVSRLDVGLTVPSVASIQSCASTSLSLFVNCN